MELSAGDFLAAALAGCATIGTSILVEKCGGVIGGTIGMMPHVAVFGSIGFHLKREADAAAGLARPSPDVFERSTLAMPLGMMANAVLQVVFREFARGSALEGPRRRLAATCAVASLTYAAVVAAGVPLVQSLETAAALWGAAVGAVVVHIAIALAMLRTHVHAPRGKTKQKALAVLARGVGTALIFLVAMAVARTLPALSGVLVNFPFVTLGTLTSVWLGQGEDVAVGAIAPMAIGMTSATLYSFLAAWLMPELGTWWGALCAWCTAIVFITLPVLKVMTDFYASKIQEEEAGAAEKEPEGEELKP